MEKETKDEFFITPTSSEDTLLSQVSEPTPQKELDKTTENLSFGITIHCNHCQSLVQVDGVTIDRKGSWLFELRCGHKIAYTFKVESEGEKAIEQFGK